MQQEDHVRAAMKLQEAIQLEADPLCSLQNRANLGCVFHRLGAEVLASEALRDALRRLRELEQQAPSGPHPARDHLKNLSAVIQLNLACSITGDPSGRRKLLDEALKLNPDFSEALFQKALSLEEDGELSEALLLLQKALAINGRDLNSLGLACRCLERLGRHQEALYMCERLCSLDVASTYVALREVFHCREDDLFVVTFPRCGTTWMVQVATCVLHGADADYDRHAIFVEGSIASSASFVWTLEVMARPRIMKMHVPADTFPGLVRGSEDELQDHGRVIYVVRNPKDALVSLRHHHANNPSIAFQGSWDEWVDQWLSGQRSREYGGTYFEHVRRWWHLRKRYPDRVHWVYFEDMKADLAGVIAGVSAFLGRELSTKEVEAMHARCSFETMKGKYKVDEEILHRVNPLHFRKGRVGSWREVLTPAQARRVDDATWRHLRQEIAEGLRIHDVLSEAR